MFVTDVLQIFRLLTTEYTDMTERLSEYRMVT